MVHSTAAHHPLTDAHPVSEESLAPPRQLCLVYIVGLMFCGVEYHFGLFRSAVLDVFAPGPLWRTSLAAWETEKSLV